MPVVEFGSGDRVGFRSPVSLSSADLTIVTLMRKVTGSDATIVPVVEAYDGTTSFWSWSYTTGNQSVFNSAGVDSYGGESFALLTVADGWCMCSLRKATGSNKPRHQRWRNSDGNTGTEDHPGAAVADSGNPPTGVLSYYVAAIIEYGVYSNLRMAWLAIFDGYLSDAQIAECKTRRKTSDVWDNSFGAPAVLLQASETGLEDVGGTLTTVTPAGTPTVFLDDDPPGWILNGVGGPAAPIPTGEPVLAGVPQTGRTLACTTGSWDLDPDNAPDSYAYQWEHDAGAGFVAIGGATSSAYLIPNSAAGEQLRCVVMASNEEGSASQASSAVTPTAPAVQFADGGSWVEKPTRASIGGSWV